MKKFLLPFALLAAISCEQVDIVPEQSTDKKELLDLQDVAKILSAVGLEKEHLSEVHDAVLSSSNNGYDEEYTMKNLFESPGSGVGEPEGMSKADQASRYPHPLRETLKEYLSSAAFSGGGTGTKSSPELSAQDYIESLQSSDYQLFWPYSENWDGESYPIITFDPLTDVDVNIGYALTPQGGVAEVEVSEEMARQRPVWVVNRNDDAAYLSLERLRRDNPEWSQGGSLVIGGGTKSAVSGGVGPVVSGGTKAKSACKTLILQDFTMMRNYDCWFAGASEFFIKLGAVESFTAATEAEMFLYNPSVTDFMVVIKRDQVGLAHELNTVLVSEWTDQLESAAFLLTEDDGGTITTWSCSAVVKYNSKSFGFDIKIPFNSRDDIVWRGTLSRKYIESSDTVTGHFGDVVLTFMVK